MDRYATDSTVPASWSRRACSIAYSSSGLITDSADVRSSRRSGVYRFSAVVAGTCLTQTTIFTLRRRSRPYAIPHTRSLQKQAADHQALDLLRALVQLGDLGVAHHAFDRVLGDVSVPAEDLDRVARDLHRVVARNQLGRAGPVRQVRSPRLHARRRS